MQHKWFVIMALIVLLVFLFWPSREHGPRQTGQVLVPWDVSLTESGHLQAMGIELGLTTLNAARRVYGADGELAIFEDKDGSRSVEAFFSEVTSGGISGRVILTLAVSGPAAAELVQRAERREPTENGTIRYRPERGDRERLGAVVVTGMTYIPYIDLTEEVIHTRFGVERERVRVDAQREHLLYPGRGIDILLDQQGKEVVQYVNPSEFDKLAAPIRAASQP